MGLHPAFCTVVDTMFRSLLSTSTNSPFGGPTTKNFCEGGAQINDQRVIAAASTEENSCEFGSAKYYALCGFGGILSCGLTHTLVTPLDLVKCRLQVNKEKYKNLGTGFKLTFQEGGASGLFLGWAPTAIGYSMQGLCKFGFYEVFKNVYAGMMGEEN